MMGQVASERKVKLEFANLLCISCILLGFACVRISTEHETPLSCELSTKTKLNENFEYEL